MSRFFSFSLISSVMVATIMAQDSSSQNQVLNKLAGGIQPTTQQDVQGDILKNIAAQKAIQHQQAEIGLTQARQALEQAKAANLEAQRPGLEAAIALQKRDIDASIALNQLLQKHAISKKDGTIDFDWDKVIDEYTALGFFDKVLELKTQLAVETQRRIELEYVKLQLTLSKSRLLGVYASQLGFGDDNMDSAKAIRAYGLLKTIAGKNEFADLLPATEDDFAKNPAQYLPSLNFDAKFVDRVPTNY
jgi:hypothetical protein